MNGSRYNKMETWADFFQLLDYFLNILDAPEVHVPVQKKLYLLEVVRRPFSTISKCIPINWKESLARVGGTKNRVSIIDQLFTLLSLMRHLAPRSKL